MKNILFPIAVATLCVSHAHAKFARPTDVPVERILKNVNAYVKLHPKDISAQYTLARVHYLAFVHKATSLNVYPRRAELMYSLAHWQNVENAARTKEAEARTLKAMGLKKVPHWKEKVAKEFNKKKWAELERLRKENWKPKGISSQEAVNHVSKSLEAFDKVLALSPDYALALLGKASLLEQYADFMKAEKKELPGGPKVETKEAIAARYYRAFEHSMKADSKSRSQPLLGLRSLVSYEAGKAYLRLKPKGEHKEQIEKHLKLLDGLPRGPITPVVIDLKGQAETISEVIDTGQSVSFDLTGLGRKFTYNWPRKNVGFLVWDPRQTGHVHDGKQLFGVYTWGIFWETGFDALASLDDDANGTLSKRELKGLAIWNDLNQNGVSDAGEVKPLVYYGISSLKTRATGVDGVHPVHLKGAQRENAAALPMWDWMAMPK